MTFRMTQNYGKYDSVWLLEWLKIMDKYDSVWLLEWLKIMVSMTQYDF